MDACGRSDWFVGDLTDPWVKTIAGALPSSVTRIHCVGDLPDFRGSGQPAPRTLVVHRPLLTPHDAEVLSRLRGTPEEAPRVVLCAGPHIRHVDLERWSPLYDVLVPEATAPDTIARHVRGEPTGRTIAGSRPRLSVVSANFELRHALCDVCVAAGYPASPISGWPETNPGGMAIWDVPVLEPSWPTELGRRSQTSQIVALIGFPDRAIVSEARNQGASACLELPCDVDDLIYVLDRLTLARSEPAHDVPPPPASLRRPNRPVVVSTPDE